VVVLFANGGPALRSPRAVRAAGVEHKGTIRSSVTLRDSSRPVCAVYPLGRQGRATNREGYTCYMKALRLHEAERAQRGRT
jgi:hypothetical protein